jgi:type II secretory pathway pseudopilin PulG
VSPSPDRHPRSADPSPVDEGFTLVEVIVALALTMVVMIALLPQLLVGIRGAALANDVTEAKGVVQGQLEKMRNLPYHVASSAERRVDLLDTYFPDLVPVTTAFSCRVGGKFVAPAESWSGYVTGTARRCEYEPNTGSFYRNVEARGDYILVTDTQFVDSRAISASTPYQPIVAETAGPYNSQGANGIDRPVSAQVGVTVTGFFLNRGNVHPASAYTQISEVVLSPTRVRGVANARALEIGGSTPSGEALSVSAGDMNIAGSLSRSSSVTATTAAVSARLSTGDAVGSRLSAIAPPTSTTATQTVPAGTLTGDGCAVSYVCWGSGQLDPVTVNADGGLPTAGSASSPVEARLTGAPGVSFRNTVAPNLGQVRPDLDLMASEPLVRGVPSGAPVATTACGPSKGGLVTGRGFMQTTATLVDTCGAAAASTVSLFPTAFAEAGVLRLTLTSAAARCTVNRSGSVLATSSYQISVQYAKPAPATGYTELVILRTSGTSVADPLPRLLNEPVGGGHVLGDYVDSWSLSQPSASNTYTTASASVPGALKLISTPLRNRAGTQESDPASVISLTLGSVGCAAEDAR